MLRSLYSAVSGINVNQKSMDVIGNNIANVNTIGYKTGRAVFQDMLSQTLNTGRAPTDSRGGINPRQVGTGAYLIAVDNIFEQGAIKATGRTHDVAIEGNGFFVVRGEGVNNYYTRAGDFNFDKSGYLTTPSGFRVQGWMSDPNTGQIQYNTSVSDIFITRDHEVMPARATTSTTFSGVLGTKATGSLYNFNKMLTQANARMNVFDALSTQGVGMDLAQNETLRVQAHATGITSMGELVNKNGQKMTLTPNATGVSFTLSNNQTYSFTYTQLGDGGANDNQFTTMQGLCNELNSMFVSAGMTALTAGATVTAAGTITGPWATITNGRVQILNNGTSVINIGAITSPNSYLANALNGLTGSYSAGTGSKTSAEMFFQQEITMGQDFNDFEELSNSVSQAINNNVVASGFEVEFLANEFGLQEGETLRFTTTAGTSYNFTYRADPADVTTATDFHSLTQLVQAMNTSPMSTTMGTFAVNNGGIEYTNTTGAARTFASIQTFDTSTPAVPQASMYLENTLSSLLRQFSAGERFLIDEVNGKGRMVYANKSGTTGENVTGFSIRKATTGDIFNANILETQGADVNIGRATISQRFLTTANESTNMRDLFTESGQYCFFIEDQSTINFAASIDNSALPSSGSFNIAIDSTVDDMMWFLEEFLGLGTDHNSRRDVTMAGGVITVQGANGEANDITALTLTAVQPHGATTFTNSFGQAIKSQTATGGRFVTDMPVYDQQGNRHMVKFDFSMLNESQNEWTMTISTSDPNTSVYINGATTNELVIRFNSDGTPSHMYDRFSNPIRVINNPTFDLNPGNGANTVRNVAVNLGTPGLRDGLTLSNATTTMNTQEQDGYSLGILEEKMFNDAGEIIGYYTNGQTRIIGQLALAVFQNNQGLQKVGDTMFAETTNSGMAAVGRPQSGSRGSIASSALESSTVDLSEEFVNMIVTQRGFQANSRVVTTSDEMIQELLNLKR